MADPGFSRGGDANPRGAPTYHFDKFSQKLDEIERIWTPRRGRVQNFTMLDPPVETMIPLSDMITRGRCKISHRSRFFFGKLHEIVNKNAFHYDAYHPLVTIGGGGLCPRGPLFRGGLCLGVFVQGVSVWGSLSRGCLSMGSLYSRSLSRGSLSGGCLSEAGRSLSRGSP